MRYAVEYELHGGMNGLCLFAADDMVAAQKYVDNLIIKYGYSTTRNLKQIPDAEGMEALYRLYPATNRMGRHKHLKKKLCPIPENFER